MKLLSFALFSMLLLACSQKETHESFPVLQVSDSEWATYEGTIVDELGRIVDVEIALKEAPVGVESYYRIYATASGQGTANGIITQGKYVVTPGLPNNSFGIQLVINQTDRQISIPGYLTLPADLYFSTNGNNQLVLTDDDFIPLANDARYNIYKRSKLFTVEGYFTLQPDASSEFLERNTHENWNVAPLKKYNQIKNGYSKIATESNEGVYLRALAYTISDASVGERHDRLVFKQIIKFGAADN